MARVTTQFFNQSVERDSFATDDSDPIYAFRGPLRRTMEFDNIQTAYALWVCLGVRDQDDLLDITIEYTTAPSTTYRVSYGRPLVLETQVGAIGLTISRITLTPLHGTIPDVEFVVLRSQRLVAALPPSDGAILQLVSTQGVATDGNGVTTWTPLSEGTAQSTFDAVAMMQPQLIANDPDFGGQPSIEFDGTDQRLIYSGNQDDFLQLATGPFTIAVIHKPDDDAELFQAVVDNIANNAGARVWLPQNYYVQGVAQNDSATNVTEDNGVPPIPRAMCTIFECTFSPGGLVDGGTMFIRNQGKEETYSHSVAPGTAVTRPLTLGGGANGGSFYKGKIVDVRVWNRRLTSGERDLYVAYAQAAFQVDDTLYDTPQKLARTVLSAQRGFTPAGGGSPAVWIPYQTDGASFASKPDVGPTQGDVSGANPPFKALTFDGTNNQALITADDRSFYGITSGTGSWTIACVWSHTHAQDASTGYIWDSSLPAGADRQGTRHFMASGSQLWASIVSAQGGFGINTPEIGSTLRRLTIVDYHQPTRTLRILGVDGVRAETIISENEAADANKMMVGGSNFNNTGDSSLVLKGDMSHWEFYDFSLYATEFGGSGGASLPLISDLQAWAKERFGLTL